MAALNRLEEIVGVPPGALAALVGPRRARGRRVYTEAPNLAELYSDWDPIAGLLSEFDTGSDDVLVRLSQYERLKLGPDGTLRELYSRALVRAATNDVTSSIVIDQATEGNAPLIGPLRGCALGTVRTRPEAGVSDPPVLRQDPESPPGAREAAGDGAPSDSEISTAAATTRSPKRSSGAFHDSSTSVETLTAPVTRPVWSNTAAATHWTPGSFSSSSIA